MKVLKFGGTSLGSAERIHTAADIVRTNPDCIVVCSAMSGMTNSLLQVASLWESGNKAAAIQGLQSIRQLFDSHCRDLFNNDDVFTFTRPLFDSAFALLGIRL
jgi:aspartate kinase